MISDPQETPAATPPSYSAELERLRNHNQTVIGEKREAQKQLDAVRNELAELKKVKAAETTKELVDQNQFKSLWEQANATNKELEQKLAAANSRIAELEKQV